ncbi:CMRF35-like molecule 8 [Cebidichthys violaceus]|uniref:CMRF35-like molecule 8 n=1 Tax=Cebidichthys violaceus TaxID=271503 RepID=UPI0035CA61B9
MDSEVAESAKEMALLDGDPSEETTFYSRPGGNILVGCVFTTSETWKYFCKGQCENKDILVATTGFRTQRGRYSIRYEEGYPSGGFVYVGITQLTRSDSGQYWCWLDEPVSPDPYHGFKIVVTNAPPTSKPNQAMTSSVPSASTATTTQSLSSTSGSSRPPARGVWLYAVIVVVLVIVSGLVLMMFCIRRNITPDAGLNTRRTSEGTNTEIALYENCRPVSTCEDSTYQSLDPASRDQDQTYSTLTHT